MRYHIISTVILLMLWNGWRWMIWDAGRVCRIVWCLIVWCVVMAGMKIKLGCRE